jgi:hypothetical protein
MTRSTSLAAAVLALAACSDSPSTPAPDDAAARGTLAAATTTVLLSGLDNPRGLAFGPEGALYVVEAGNTTINGPCIAGARGQLCYSGTGGVTRYWKGRSERVVSGLPSQFNQTTTDVTGAHDIGFVGLGNAFITIGWGGNPARRVEYGALGANFGHLIKLEPSGGWRAVADVSAVEAESNPAGGPVDSNPFGLLNEPGVRFVADAGGNSLIEIRADGSTSVVATFGPTPAPAPFGSSEAVPTEVERGPDGALYVSKLTGVPFVAGSAAIMRVVPGEAPTEFAGGFKTITDFAFAPDGSMYVVEYASAPVFFGGPGRLTRVAPDGTRQLVSSALQTPTGVTVGPDGAVYVSNKGALSGAGEVLRIVP